MIDCLKLNKWLWLRLEEQIYKSKKLRINY